MRHIYFEDANGRQCAMGISDSNADALSQITSHELFEHVRQCIGKVTPEGLERFIPEYVPEGSDLKISIQVHYYLWKKRIEGRRKLEDNSPITAKELESIIGGEDQGESLPVDVRVILGSTHILPATQMCIDELAHYLRGMEQRPNCEPSIEDEKRKITAEFAWDIYNFINEYSAGEMGIVPLQEALDKHFDAYVKKEKSRRGRI